MQALLPLLPRSALWPALHELAELVAIHDEHGSQRALLAGTATRQEGDRVWQEGQLLSVGGGLRGRATSREPANNNGLARAAGPLGSAKQSAARHAAAAMSGALLLVGGRGGVRDGH